ncbi:MAG: AGE family epimerase/isomerase [Candidatus Schekmanbacteria bacterium]|nr:AGE family epimerase/isomerase [Candidatus Schekmanbacteria bacterium]
MNNIDSIKSDLIAGYVKKFDQNNKKFSLETSDGKTFDCALTDSVYARLTQNTNENYLDCTNKIGSMLKPGQLIYAYGIDYHEKGKDDFEVKSIVFPGEQTSLYRHEEPNWWINQLRSVATCYLQWQFNYPNQAIDYKNYRTILHLAGAKKGDFLQETDTISRLVYGMASAYLCTGEDMFLEAAEKGTEYLREHMRFYDTDEDLIYWYHGIKVSGDREQKLLSSEFGDDFDSIPMYEQIYALAGPIQTYRITGDPLILSDAEKTIDLFERYYKDNEYGGYFSHIDPLTFDPLSPTLDKGNNRGKKNWNSVGDHAPAYLINLWLATGEKKYEDFLVYTADTIAERFPDDAHSPFVQERFFRDWKHDTTWGWQQNRGVIGHNLKIAWNLMRINHLRPSKTYVELAEKIAGTMPAVGSDRQRGGWYDVIERTKQANEKFYRLVWHDRKAWWQQEQAILAYLIMYGSLENKEYLKHSREAAAFYNAFFIDHDDGGVYFNVLANGMPYLLGTERLKGSHSMSCYHSTELCYLSAVYLNLLITGNPLDLYFKPKPNAFKDRILRVAPDILPKGRVKLTSVKIDGNEYSNFDANAMTVKLPNASYPLKVQATLTPTKKLI